jgi:hypothetical protein
MHGDVRILVHNGQPTDLTITASDAAGAVRRRLEGYFEDKDFRVANPWDAPVLKSRTGTIHYRRYYRS